MTESENLPTGPAWAAILSAGFGCLTFGVLVDLAEASPKISSALNFHNPTGDLSGKSTLAVVIWLIIWAILHTTWKKQTVKSPGTLTVITVILVLLSILAVFPPFFELFAAK